MGPGRGQARGEAWPPQGNRRREVGAGPVVTYRRLMVPRRLRLAQALTDCAPAAQTIPQVPGRAHSEPFKRGRTRGPPG